MTLVRSLVILQAQVQKTILLSPERSPLLIRLMATLLRTVSSAASNGTASIDAAGAWTYAPNEDFNGSDSFTVKVTDDDGHEETQVITLTVSPVNDAGSFSGDTSGTGLEDSEDDITGTLTFTDSIDGDSALTFTVSSGR